MNFNFNGNHPNNIFFNGFEVLIVNWDGVKVWEKNTEPTVEVPSFACVDLMSEYTDTTYSFVYEWDGQKWFAKNNLNKYEEYGIIETGTSLSDFTTYPNKLVAVGEDEYQFQNGSWVNVGSYHSSFGVIGTLDRNNPPSQFPTSFALAKSDIEPMGWFDFTIYGMNGDLRIDGSITNLQYRITDWLLGGSFDGIVTSDDNYYYFSCPNYPNETFEVSDLLWWYEPISYYGGTTSYDVEYPTRFTPSNSNTYTLEELQNIPISTDVWYGEAQLVNGQYYEFTENNGWELTDKYIVFDQKIKLDKLSEAYTHKNGLFSYDDAKSVTTIINNLFSGTSIINFEELQYFTNLQVIGDYAFYQCSSLNSIAIPNSVTSIGSSAFGYCSSLTSVTIPDSVTSMSTSVFVNCSNLKEVQLSNNITTLGSITFQSCGNLTRINSTVDGLAVVPEGVIDIGSNAFYGCKKLTKYILPQSLSGVNYQVWQSGTSITDIIFLGQTAPKETDTSSYYTPFGYARTSSYSSRTDYAGASIGQPRIWYPSGGTNYTLTSTNSATYQYDWLRVASVGRTTSTTYRYTSGSTVTVKGYGFSKSATTFEYSEEVTPISDTLVEYKKYLTFNGMSYLIKKKQLIKEDYAVLYGRKSSMEWQKEYYYDGVIDHRPSGWGVGGQYDVIINSGITSIGVSGFSDLQVQSIIIPNSVTRLENYALNNTRIRTIDLPNNLKYIGWQALSNLSYLTDIIIPNSVENIAGVAFMNSYALTSVTWNAKCNYINYNVFNSCKNLKVIDFSGGATQVLTFRDFDNRVTNGNSNHINTTSLQYIVVPDNLYSSWYASSYWTNFKQYLIKKSDYDNL